MTTGAERWTRYGIVPLVIYAVVRATVTAAGKPFWYDELFTWAMAQQPDFATLWDALLHGGDSMPPVFEWIEHAFIGFPTPEIAMQQRVPQRGEIGLLRHGPGE